MSYNAQFVEALKEALNGLRTIHSVGEEWCSYIGKIPVGGVPYCGQEVTRSTYSALWQYAQHQGLVKSESEWQSIASAQGGNVPFYSSGDGSSTFRMPRLVGYVRGASGQSEAGSYVKEGLPNITGDIKRNGSNYKVQIFADAYVNEIANTGALALYSTGNSIPGIANGNEYSGVIDAMSFDASRSNAIYGNSNHVTPETSVVLFGVYAFGEVTNTGALDAETLATGLARVEANKADKTQWVYKFAQLSSSTEMGTFTLDLSDYLPGEELYEVMFKMSATRDDTSGTNTNIGVGWNNEWPVNDACDGSNWQTANVSGVLPMSRATGFTYRITGYSPKTAPIYLFGYKKVS